MAIDLRNEGSYKFFCVSTEEYREYVFIKEGQEHTVKIKNPHWLAISGSGHRILDAEGISYFIPFGWIRLLWKAKPGCPHFVK